MKNLHFDFETYCDIDLKASGVHRYVEHPSFMPLCVAWRVDNGPVMSARSVTNDWFPRELRDLLLDPEVQGHAWNAAFERTVLRRLRVVPAHPLSCTMQRALAYGLPAKLEKAALALGIENVKDMAGHRLMLKMSKPPRYSATAEEWVALLRYCERDVLAESDMAAQVPQLSSEEAELSQIDAEMNDWGIWVDLAQVQALKTAAQAAEKAEGVECTRLTAWDVTSPGTQTARLLKWLKGRGLSIVDVARATIEEKLQDRCSDLEKDIAEVLRIRLRTARASTKKLQSMLSVASSGDRLRGQFQFLGAARTGRWSGRLVQPQNLPRIPPGFAPLWFAEAAREVASLDAIAPAPVLDCVAWSLRSCLGEGPSIEGPSLWGFDFSQIEARVLAWLAGQHEVLEIFRSGQDVYLWAAAQFGSQNRQLGKVLILALGFGMGAAKLKDTAKKDYLVTMTMDEAERFKRGWRQRNHRIVDFWYEIEDAARKAILQRGNKWFPCGNGIALRASSRTLQMRLPSGRVLYYHNPQVETGSSITYYGEEKGQWVRRRTWGGTLAENATQAVARDVMSSAMLRVFHSTKRIPLMTVHDELVYRYQAPETDLQALMLTAPDWAGGLPIAGEVKVMKRYGVLK